MLNELWAKLTAGEKYIVYGVVAVVVGWLVGLIFGSSSTCAGLSGLCNVNYFTSGSAGLMGILALVLALATAVVLYLKIAPNTNITWPMPVSQILLGLAGLTLILAVITALINLTGPSGAPVLMYLADLLLVAGGAVMAWFAYQAWMVTRA